MKLRTAPMVLFLCLLLLLALTACMEPPPGYVTATHDPVQAFADANRSQATAQAALATADYFSSQLTATVEAANARATDQAWQATASAQAVQATRQALLLSSQLTATERSWQASATSDSANATHTAAGTGTALSWQSTATQSALNATRTVDAANAAAVATIQAAEAQRVLLALERDRMTNQAKAVVPWLIVILIFCATFGVGVVYFWRRSRLIFFGRDRFGDTQKVLIHQGGHTIAYDPDRSFSPILDIQPDGKPLMPPTAHPELQAGVTMRDQAIDLARAMPAHQRRIPRIQPQVQPALPASTPQIEVVEATQVRPWLDEVQTKLLTEETS
jgi:hypothetical protein